jgi:hypothetical protein
MRVCDNMKDATRGSSNLATHTAGTLLGELHVDIHVIQVTTTRIYTDPTDPLTREAADRIGGLLWPEGEHSLESGDSALVTLE